jgi:hypothetical protein
MRLWDVLMIAVFGLLGCGDSGSSVSDTANELCNRELCQTSAVLRDECLEIVTACLNKPNANRDECAIAAGEKCDGG